MKITKERLKQIIKEELEEIIAEEQTSGNLSNIYKLCPPNTECKPETQKTNWWGSRGKLNEEQQEEVEESIRIGRRPRLQGPPSDDIENYDPVQIKLRRDFKEIGLDLPHDPSEEEKRFLIRRIHTKLRRNADAETVDKLRDLKFRLNTLVTVTDRERREFFNQHYAHYRMNEELTRQDKTDIKKIVQDELDKMLKKKETKKEMSEIVKKIMKKLYKDLSIEHSYIIDRIKI